MAIIYTYPLMQQTVVADDLLLMTDISDDKKTKSVLISALPFTNNAGTVTSVALTMPAAFAVANSPITTAGTLAVTTTGGASGQYLDYTGNWSTPPGGGGGGTPGGSDTQIQYNNGGSFGGTTGLTWDDSTNILSIATRYEGDIDGAVLQQVLVKESGGVSKGDVVYISGGTGDNPEVMKAKSDSSTTMPALGIMKANTAEDAVGECITSGELTGVNLSSFSTGDELFVSDATAGRFISSAPTSEDKLIQKIGKVIKGGTGGALTVLGAFRTNATPNLNEGSIFIGNSSNQSSTLSIGANNTVLTSDGTTASWEAPVDTTYTFTSPSSGILRLNDGSTNQDVSVSGGTGITINQVAANNVNVNLNTATATAKGGIELFSNTVQSVAANAVSSTANRTYGLQLNAAGQGVVNVPWTSGGGSAVGFSPIDVGSADQAPTAATTQYYYLTVAEATMTIAKAKIWGFSGSNNVLFGLYRGTFSSHTLIGEGNATCGIGPNEITLAAAEGQNLNVTVGENLIVGIYATGTSWRSVYDDGISDLTFGQSNTTNITAMPADIEGSASSVRFACTLY